MLSSGNSLRLHHIGFVVASIEASVPGFVQTLGARWKGEIFADLIQKVRVTFLETPGCDAQVELVQPDAQDAPVKRFLCEQGQGLHHLCYEVRDIDSALVGMRAEGAIVAKRPKPAVAFGGRRIAWVLTADKLLVELLEV